jgi:hypothetical protein
MNNWRFRTNWRGKLILQRRIRTMRMVGPSAEPGFEWRDATSEDLGFYYAELRGVQP